MPNSACCLRLRPSKPNGMVAIPMVKIPISRAMPAITGAAPVPVPPPIPAVMKAIRVPFPKRDFNSSTFSMAAFFPTSGIAPAPRPLVRLGPNCIL